MFNLVTGASGFTGGHLVQAMLRDGEQVRALVRRGGAATELAQAGAEIFEGELTDRDAVLQAAKGCDRIFHIAAVFRTAGHPDQYYFDVNVGGTRNVIEAARHWGCERLVHCSTGGVHGHVANPPADENYRFQPDDVYQRSKLEGEQAVQAAGRAGQPVCIVRPGAIYGEGDLRFLKLFRSIQRRRFVMIGTGRTRLHMVHVEDLVDGIRLCGASPAALGEVFLLAGPEAPTLNEIVATTAGILKIPPPRWHVPVWPVYTAGLLCEMACVPLGIDPPLHRRRVGFFTHNREFNIDKARQRLGYAPRIDVRTGIERTMRWYAANGYMDAIPA